MSQVEANRLYAAYCAAVSTYHCHAEIMHYGDHLEGEFNLISDLAQVAQREIEYNSYCAMHGIKKSTK